MENILHPRDMRNLAEYKTKPTNKNDTSNISYFMVYNLDDS